MYPIIKNVVHSIVKKVRDLKVSGFKRRSPEWPKVRKAFLAKNTKCAVCGSSVKLEAHHIKPFHIYPEEELNPNNLIALCESKSFGMICHMEVGHSGNYRFENINVEKDVKTAKSIIVHFKNQVTEECKEKLRQFADYLHGLAKTASKTEKEAVSEATAEAQKISKAVKKSAKKVAKKVVKKATKKAVKKSVKKG